jgi:hypothetical protein
LACVVIAAVAAQGFAADAPQAASPATQVWLVDTRCAPGCGDLEAGLAQINYWRLVEANGCGQWQAADAAAFQASADPAEPTTILIHGYGTDSDWAVRHGNEIYGQMIQISCKGDSPIFADPRSANECVGFAAKIGTVPRRPFRLVIWSWPADRGTRRLRQMRADIQMKACRSDVEAYYLAQVLSGLPRGEPLSLLGFSLGCRTVSGTLELLAGGAAGGRALPPPSLQAWRSSGPRPIRAMMIAAAIDDDWLEPSAPAGLAPVEVQRILVSMDCRDRVLKWYSRLYGPHGPEAMGVVGPAGPAGGKLEVVDVTCEVGRRHNFDRYEETWPICQRLGWYTFLCGDATATEDSAKKSGPAANKPAVQ